MIALLDGHPGRGGGDDVPEDWFALLAVAALSLTALLLLRRLNARRPW